MKPKKRLAIITSHPIQYNAPLFRLMNQSDVNYTIKVFYTWGQSEEKVFDREFGISVKWDVPLLDGYEYTFVKNTSTAPGSHHFNGIVNPTLNKEIEAWKPDAILVFGWSFHSHLRVMRHFYKKVPVLFRGDSTLIDEPTGFSIKKMVRRIFLTWVYRHVDVALYVGSANKKYYLKHGLTSSQLLFAPHAVDNDRFSNDQAHYSQKAQDWRNNLGIGENEVVFLFAAKFSEKKDPELLIKAFIALNKPGTWLILVGNGELESGLKEKYGSNASIHFIDFKNQSEMPVVYRLGDVFVLPSKGPGETWGLAINEAMACGRAVIGSDKCGCSYNLVVNDKNGYIFESGNIDSLMDCLNKVMLNYKEQQIASAQMIKEWSYAKTVDQLRAFFEKTIVG
jgi:glycosyltransferase involved in cell wall biosynthesis